MALQAYLAAASATRQRWNTRYAEGETPWDTQITPPEVESFWQSGLRAPTAIALDLGCGPGTNVRFLARLGLRATGVEIAGAPLLTAQQRLAREPASVRARAAFVCADVCALPFNALDAGYALDIGCLHSLPREQRSWYAQGVIANLAPGGFYHLYAFDDDGRAAPGDRGPHGMLPGEVARLFTPTLTLLEEIRARPDRRPCRWYLLRKP